MYPHNQAPYSGNSLIKNTHPFRITIGPKTQGYFRVPWGGGSYERGTLAMGVLVVLMQEPRTGWIMPRGLDNQKNLLVDRYRDTSLIRNNAPLGPNRDNACGPMVVLRGGAGSYEGGTPVVQQSVLWMSGLGMLRCVGRGSKTVKIKHMDVHSSHVSQRHFMSLDPNSQTSARAQPAQSMQPQGVPGQ